MAIDKNAIERETKKKTTGYLNEELNSFNAGIDAENARITENGEKTIETTKQGYEDVFRKNRLNQIINEEKTKERMANLGLIDSGLNRSQQTAIQLQAANADAAAVRNRQAAIDTIRRGISDAIAVNDAKKADYKRERTSYWNEKADAMIANEYNTKVAEENARIEAELKAEEAKQKAYNDMMEKLNNTSLTGAYKASVIQNYADTYNNGDPTPYMTLIDNYGFEVGEGNVIQEKKAPSYSFVKTDDKFNWFGGLNQRDSVMLVDDVTGKPVKEIKISELENILNRDQRLKLSKLGGQQAINVSELGINTEAGMNNLVKQLTKEKEPVVINSDSLPTGLRNAFDHSPTNFLDWLNMLGNHLTYTRT